ncbi:hypothetical protein B296_00025226 [Ensete ventricosum]|uniref:Uncharacterized protein n=1 Tax=Ensete ventricosum TaxID=4639 RepID=A0A426YXI0_ENSVE|nr:hypothetical protein B296_00025226 [Ensete ventricosum]
MEGQIKLVGEMVVIAMRPKDADRRPQVEKRDAKARRDTAKVTEGMTRMGYRTHTCRGASGSTLSLREVKVKGRRVTCGCGYQHRGSRWIGVAHARPPVSRPCLPSVISPRSTTNATARVGTAAHAARPRSHAPCGDPPKRYGTHVT